MIYGYARVSTDGQSVDAQVRQLTKAGCKKVFRETASGAQTDRAQLRKALAKATAERDHHMNKRGELKTLLDSAGSMLVNGVRKYHDGIIADQEQAPDPLFLNKAAE